LHVFLLLICSGFTKMLTLHPVLQGHDQPVAVNSKAGSRNPCHCGIFIDHILSSCRSGFVEQFDTMSRAVVNPRPSVMLFGGHVAILFGFSGTNGGPGRFTGHLPAAASLRSVSDEGDPPCIRYA
jgi:hypothetical protein